MTIEEKKKVLEFTYSSDNITTGDNFDIVYDEMNGRSISIKNGSSKIVIPIELLTEMTDFLASKGIIKNNNSNMPHSNSNIENVYHVGQGLPIPKIENKKESDNIKESEIITPISSFDISQNNSHVNKAPKDLIKNPVDDKEGAVFGNEENKISEEKINRPVIRTRIKDENDPLQAEREASIARGAGKDSVKKIKRSNREG